MNAEVYKINSEELYQFLFELAKTTSKLHLEHLIIAN